MKTKSFVLLIAGIVLVGGAIGGAFLGGEAVGRNSAMTTLSPALQNRSVQFGANGQVQFGINGTRQPGAALPGGRIIGGPGGLAGGTNGGVVQAIEGNIVTVTSPNGSVIRVVLGANTTIEKLTQGITGDITAGSNITVGGPRNSDGSIQALTVLLNQTAVH